LKITSEPQAKIAIQRCESRFWRIPYVTGAGMQGYFP